MHDIRAIRENPAAFDAGLALRNLPPVSGEILSLDGQRRAAIMQAESDQAEQNKASKEAGAAKARGDNAEFERLREFVAQRKQSVADLTRQAAELDGKLRELLLGIPNLPLESVPPGKDESDNVEIRRWGNPRKFDFTAREHFEIEGVRPGMDFETASKLSGARFVVLKGGVARIQRALAQLPEIQPTLEALARARAQQLLEDHRRVRVASDARGEYRVTPSLPVDIMGVFVLIPA